MTNSLEGVGNRHRLCAENVYRQEPINRVISKGIKNCAIESLAIGRLYEAVTGSALMLRTSACHSPKIRPLRGVIIARIEGFADWSNALRERLL